MDPNSQRPDLGDAGFAVANAAQKLRAVMMVGIACIVVPGFLIAGVYFIAKLHAVLPAIFCFAMGALWLLFTIFGVRIGFKKRTRRPTADTPFSGMGMLSTTTIQQFARTQMAADEHIMGWLGPLGRSNFADQNTIVLFNETVRAAENTLLITNRQIIGLALVQQDFDGLPVRDGGRLMAGISQLGSVTENAFDQQLNLEMANNKRWPQMVQTMQQGDLNAFLGNHFQFGIPLNVIASVEVKDRFINAGVHIVLTNGKVLKYATLAKDRLAEFASAVAAAGLAVS